MKREAPLAWLYGAVCSGTTLARTLWYATSAPDPAQLRGAAVVYMRWNLENDQAYVGETEQWDKRNEQHYMRRREHTRSRVRARDALSTHAALRRRFEAHKQHKHRPGYTRGPVSYTHLTLPTILRV